MLQAGVVGSIHFLYPLLIQGTFILQYDGYPKMISPHPHPLVNIGSSVIYQLARLALSLQAQIPHREEALI